MNPERAFHYAMASKPAEDTRVIVCQDPRYAYYYAIFADRYPREDTRKAACQDSYYAYCYAEDVDKCPTEDTRKAACEDPRNAYLYAINVDKGFHEETYDAIRGTEYEKKYEKFMKNLMKEEVI